MTINHIKDTIEKVMETIDTIDFINTIQLRGRTLNQSKINKAYKMLDNLRDEFIREEIKQLQKKE